MPLWERGCQPFSLSDVPMLDGDMRHIAVMALLSDWMEHRSYDPDALIPTLRPYLDSLSSISEEELGRPAQCFHGYQKALDLDLPGFFLFDVMLWNIQHIARGQIFQALLRDGWNPEALLLHGISNSGTSSIRLSPHRRLSFVAGRMASRCSKIYGRREHNRIGNTGRCRYALVLVSRRDSGRHGLRFVVS